jgi:hypothetical protein
VKEDSTVEVEFVCGAAWFPRFPPRNVGVGRKWWPGEEIVQRKYE